MRAFRAGADGREQVIHTERAGATLAEVPVFDNGTYPATAVADEDSVVLFIAKRLHQDGLILLDNRRVTITDEELLAAYAGES